MKNTLIFLLILSPLLALSQAYTPFPDLNVIWRDYSWIESKSSGTSYYTIHDRQYHLEEKINVNGYTYTRVRRAMWEHDVTEKASGTTHDSTFTCEYFGAIRSDSLKRIYFLPVGSNTEQLLYDFTLKAGDSLPVSYNYNTAYGTLYVSYIDSIYLAGKYRKRFNISTTPGGSPHVSVIEGIGNIRGLFATLILPPAPSYMYSMNLTCLYLDDTIAYSKDVPYPPVPRPESCSLFTCGSVTGIGKSYGKQEIHIYPSPATGFITIEFNEELRENWTVYIFDETGRVLIQKKMNNNSLDISLLKPGFYILRLVNENGISREQKIIKL